MANKLIGQNYTTPDLVAKVTGRAKYAEDFRADGMLFCKLLLSPLPHARVKSIDTSKALAMPGVKASSPPTSSPRPPTSSPISVRRFTANTKGEKALTNEPVYQGEPVLAVAAVDELTAAEAIEKIEIDVGAAAVRRRSAREPAAGRTERAARRQRLGPAEAAGAGPAGRCRRRSKS